MHEKVQSRWDLLLLLSLLLVILTYPVLDHGDIRRLILAAVLFAPVILATVRMSQIKARVWPLVALMSSALIFAVSETIFPNRTFAGIKWGLLTVFFGFGVACLFSYLKNSHFVSDAHLYTAVSIYLLIGMQWFALYSAFDVDRPGSILHNTSVATDRQTELLYFSLVTLSTIGYGDVVPLNGEVRMLAVLEGITGVLYIAITVALLVSAYKQQSSSNGSSEVTIR
jgi:Ion channel